ncbi:hypothetical protein HX787_17805 [Pseudomonas tolaasii]|uniref:Uncharacterized protein n=2 Tax=Pseudomonas tolaasii TaxID=29442 RepID=A0A7Y8DS79_PSETO|nr:hypothetical protein [Pseudomonas tolaasii]ARB29944.1 hypothetical protein B5P22_22510 [Pseudomonas tolaasii]KAB0476352.1 hypothetical protein F7R12_10970 [Pseudomonas tolaasii]MBY8939815.1 hypothetical protein [Pseudomonas tolaasii]NWC21212.1 hypothetical protein [Pseudomonas tolaasii]NWC39141.1 hypothetical protein [Pseudomonas tolaasii]
MNSPLIRRRNLIGLFVAALIIWIALYLGADDPEIALMLGEPWEDMRQRSSAGIDPAIPGHHWFRTPKSDARLRLADPQYGFTTPLARFFTIGFDDERVGSIRMSPQVEPLLLDETLKIALDLQDQWRKAGWDPIRVESDPSLADTPEWRARLRNVNLGGTSYWRAGNKYQVMLVVGRFRDDRYPLEERYLMTLSLAGPWGPP